MLEFQVCSLVPTELHRKNKLSGLMFGASQYRMGPMFGTLYLSVYSKMAKGFCGFSEALARRGGDSNSALRDSCLCVHPTQHSFFFFFFPSFLSVFSILNALTPGALLKLDALPLPGGHFLEVAKDLSINKFSHASQSTQSLHLQHLLYWALTR